MNSRKDEELLKFIKEIFYPGDSVSEAEITMLFRRFKDEFCNDEITAKDVKIWLSPGESLKLGEEGFIEISLRNGESKTVLLKDPIFVVGMKNVWE